MLQWKPKLIVLAVLVLIAALAGAGQFTWESFGGVNFDQFTWL
jgi:hypothetical protein